jgi:glycosyltransferase involved in cell wall biosynthesis
LEIVHVINSLDTGGAETVLLRLLTAGDRSEFRSHVVSLTDLGPIAGDLNDLGVTTISLGLGRTGPFPNPFRALRLANIIRATGADVVQTWMYHSNLIGGVAALLAGRRPVIWGVRQTNLDHESVPTRTALVAKIGGRLSGRLATRIVFNSEISRQAHRAVAYADEIAQVIPNGFDTDVFRPDEGTRGSVRRELGISDDTVLVGILARYNPQKDYANFVGAAANIHRQHPDVQFVMVGLDVDQNNRGLMDLIDAAGLKGVCHLLGHRSDIPRLAAAFDVGCLSSMGEGFPNVVGEMMACGVPCAVTNVGDTASLVGDTGRVVPPKDPEALGGALSSLIELGGPQRQQLGALARKRVEESFSIQSMVNAFQTVWREVADLRNPGSGP